MTIIPQAGCKRRWRGALVAALLLFGFGTPAQAQVLEEAIGPNSFRIGINRTLISGAKFTVENTAGTISDSNSDSMTGNDLYAEMVFFSRFGIEVDIGLTEMEREYDLNIGGTLASVDESSRLTAVFANLYFQDQSTTGFKFFFGLGSGVVQVTNSFTSGALGVGSVRQSVQVNLMKIGLDWLTENAGFRTQLITMTGDKENETAIPGFKLISDYSATVFAIGIFAFF